MSAVLGCKQMYIPVSDHVVRLAGRVRRTREALDLTHMGSPEREWAKSAYQLACDEFDHAAGPLIRDHLVAQVLP